MDIPNQETFKHKIIMRIDGLAGKIGQRVLWEKANFYVRGGDKLAIIGPNGSGKTTLIKMIVNQAEGISLSPAVRLGYFSQNLNILEEEKTILENVSVTSKQTETLMRIILARLHFFTDDVHKKVGILSGGERVKVALAKLLLSDINTLVLDEPTNYLDIEAMGALESLLKDYEGTVIFVTHDRHFIGEIATRILEIGQQKLYLFEGGYDAYLQDIQAKSSSRLQDEILVIETKISDVLSRLSIEPSEALEEEFQQLLVDKKELKRQDL